jgi:hypothetical protein
MIEAAEVPRKPVTLEPLATCFGSTALLLGPLFLNWGLDGAVPRMAESARPDIPCAARLARC